MLTPPISRPCSIHFKIGRRRCIATPEGEINGSRSLLNSSKVLRGVCTALKSVAYPWSSRCLLLLICSAFTFDIRSIPRSEHMLLMPLSRAELTLPFIPCLVNPDQIYHVNFLLDSLSDLMRVKRQRGYEIVSSESDAEFEIVSEIVSSKPDAGLGLLAAASGQ